MNVDIDILTGSGVINLLGRTDNVKRGLDFFLNVLVFVIVRIGIFLVNFFITVGVVTLEMTVVISVIFVIVEVFFST